MRFYIAVDKKGTTMNISQDILDKVIECNFNETKVFDYFNSEYGLILSQDMVKNMANLYTVSATIIAKKYAKGEEIEYFEQ